MTASLPRLCVPLLTLAALGAAAGCHNAHVAPYEPKSRKIKLPATPPPVDKADQASLFTPGQDGFFEGVRALKVGDIVIVQVEENAVAERESETGINRESSFSTALQETPIIGPLVPLNLGDLSADVQANAGSNTNFQSDGRTGRTETVVATVPAVVKQVLPNGNLLVEGYRVVLVNQEEQHLYVSGIIRPFDVDSDNQVLSSRVAAAEIEFVGKGMVTDNQNQAWFSRFLSWAFPF